MMRLLAYFTMSNWRRYFGGERRLAGKHVADGTIQRPATALPEAWPISLDALFSRGFGPKRKQLLGACLIHNIRRSV